MNKIQNHKVEIQYLGLKDYQEAWEYQETLFKSVVDISAGTGFQKAVWKKLLEVPYGEVITYKELACAVGRPAAARAVGNAVGANPVPIVIPCHRVLAANGLGGYACGVEIKKDLLKLEGALA